MFLVLPDDLCFSSFSKTDFILSSKKLSLCFLDGVRETILDKAFLFLGVVLSKPQTTDAYFLGSVGSFFLILQTACFLA